MCSWNAWHLSHFYAQYRMQGAVLKNHFKHSNAVSVYWHAFLLLFIFFIHLLSYFYRISWKSTQQTSLALLLIFTLISLKKIGFPQLLPSKSTALKRQCFFVKPTPKILRNLKHTVLTEVLQEEFVLKLSKGEALNLKTLKSKIWSHSRM